MKQLILGVETSCDETAAAVVDDTLQIRSSVVSSQMDRHARYGGVVPEIASRVHVLEVIPVISKALADASIAPAELAAIAVTRGPGLIGSLLVGVSAAKALALAWKKPIVGVNHLEGHLASASMSGNAPEYPCLLLLVSGGHTLLASIDQPGYQRILGATRDDSVGEAYDKVARLLGLGYPGGPVIDRLAKTSGDLLPFPRPMFGKGLDFSFSGLKTAVRNYVRSHPEYEPAAVAASFAAAVMDVIVDKIERALDTRSFRSIAVVGGVAASPILRERLAGLGSKRGIAVCLSPIAISTDNAAMIAAAAWAQFRTRGGDSLDFGVAPSWGLPTHDVPQGSY